MIDYIFVFPDEATARAAFQAAGLSDEEGFDGSRVLPVQMGIGEEVTGKDPETGADIMRPLYAQGFWIVASTPEVREDLWAIPACMREADRDAAERREPYVLRERFTAEQLATPWWISPQWCGVSYSNNPDAAT